MSTGRRYRLDAWSVVSLTGPYCPPECSQIALSGKRSDGEIVTTSPIKTISGRTVTTASGSTYVLGRVAPAYHAFLQDNKVPFNPARPISLVSRPSK